MPVTDATDLYGLALEHFIAERAALAKMLRGEGRQDEAKRVSVLRKPSVAAWAVNQLARHQRAALADLFAVGEELSRVQAELLGGRGDRGALRAATIRERDGVNRLTQAAHELLSGEGHEPSAATLERVSDTLHAAARDERARDLVRGGCLERELRVVGLGPDTAFSGAISREPHAADAGPARNSDRPQPDYARPREREADDEHDEALAEHDEALAEHDDALAEHDEALAERERAERDRADRDRAERDRAERERAERERADRDRADRDRADRDRATRLTEARRAESDARGRADRSAQELDVARQRRDQAAQALRNAEAALVRAQAQADAAASTHRSAKQALQRLAGVRGRSLGR